MDTKLHVNWKAGLLSGIIAGAIFLILELAMVPIFGGGSPWGPPRMIAAIVMGEEVLAPVTFDLGIVLAAVIVHFVMSIIYAFIFALVIEGMHLRLGPALVVGAAGGILLYVINFYGFTALFPWFVEARNWITIFSHLVFGLMAALVYVEMTHPHAWEKRIFHFRERKV